MGLQGVFLSQLAGPRTATALVSAASASLLLGLPIHVPAFLAILYLMVVAVTTVHEGFHGEGRGAGISD